MQSYFENVMIKPSITESTFVFHIEDNITWKMSLNPIVKALVISK